MSEFKLHRVRCIPNEAFLACGVSDSDEDFPGTKVTVLITGGAGYIGSHIALTMIDAGQAVVVLDDLSTGFAAAVPGGALLVEGRVGDKALLSWLLSHHGIEAIVHCAGSTSVPESCEDPLAYYRNNTVEAHALIEEAVAAGVKHIVFSSTAAVYGPVDGTPVKETRAPLPVSPYGASKAMTERMLSDATDAGALKAISLRYFNVAGADPAGRVGQSTRGTQALMKCLSEAALGKRDGFDLHGTDWPTPDGTAVRDFVHVSDLAEAHRAALDLLRGGGEPGAYNCGSGTGHSVREAIEMFQSRAELPFQVQERSRRSGDLASVIADTRKFHQATGWSPRHPGLGVIADDALAWERRLTDRDKNSTAKTLSENIRRKVS